MQSSLRFLISGLFVTVPLALLFSGCGGSNGGLVTPTPTSTATTTPTASPTTIPTSTQGISQTSNITLVTGQRAILITQTNGTAITGTVQILNPGALPFKTRAMYYGLELGIYPVIGTFTPPRGYNISVTNNNGQRYFSMKGLFSTTTQPGTYALTIDERIAVGIDTDNGIIPPIGTPFPTPTPQPTPTIQTG